MKSIANDTRFIFYIYAVITASVTFAHIYHTSYFIDEYCSSSENVVTVGVNGSSSYGYLQATRSQFYPQDIHCKLTIQSPRNTHITLRFEFADIYNYYGLSAGYCQLDYLNIVGESENSFSYCYYYLYRPALSLYSSVNYLNFTFASFNVSEKRKGFALYYTVFRSPPCNNDEYYCYYMHRCIPKEVACDGHDNCGDWTDEGVSACGLGVAAIVSISIVCSLAAIAIAVFILYCLADMKKRKQMSRERNQVNPDFTAVYQTGASAQNHYAEPPPPYIYSNDAFAGNADVGSTAGAAGGNVVFTMTPPYEEVTKNKDQQPPNYNQ